MTTSDDRAPRPFPKAYRLLAKAEFDAVFGENRSRADRLVVVYLRLRDVPEGVPADSLPTRVGLVVGKKAGNAVVRNRVKRLLREAFRRLHPDLPPALDVVLLPRPEAVAEYELPALEESLRKLIRVPLPDRRPPRPRGKRKRK